MRLVDRVLGGLGYAGSGKKDDDRMRRISANVPDFYGYVQDALEERYYTGDLKMYEKFAERYALSSVAHAPISKIILAIGMAGVEHFRLYEPGRAWARGKPIEEHELYELLKMPNPELTQQELFEAIGGWREIAGNAYVYIHCDDSTGVPLSLWPLRPGRVTPVRDKERGLVGYTYKVNQKPFFLEADKVMHVRAFNPLDDTEGLSPSAPAARAVAADLAMQQYNLAYFRNGGALGYVFESERETVDPKQRELMEKLFVSTHTGSSKSHKPFFLWGGFKLRDTGKGPKDTDFSLGRRQNLDDALAVYGVHNALISSHEVNLANAEAGEYMFAKYALLPRLTAIAAQMNKDLCWRFSVPCEAAFAGVVPEDDKARSEVAEGDARAVALLIQALGYKAGLVEAKARGLLSEDVTEDMVEGAMETEIEIEDGTPAEKEAMAKAAFGHEMAAWYLRKSRQRMAEIAV